MQEAVRRDRSAAVDARGAREVGEPPAGLLDDHLNGGEIPFAHAEGVDRPVDGAFGDEHVRPEVPETANVPGAPREIRHAVLVGEAQHGVLDDHDRRHGDALAVRERALASFGPPAAAEGRSRDDAEAQLHHPSSSAISVAQTGIPRA